ncbi:MAG TPA: flagellar motor switch protein FliM [Deltaproteobacteria bacterium]|jgi:flagellar motor switch protein FliM|nr:flagellar motor switch protein FliM [Deltaproteobacteria bacterium]
MEKILSQDEVDALLKGLSDGDIDTAKEGDGSQDGIRTFDLTNQDKIVRGRMPTLDIINDRFGKIHRSSLSGSLRRMLDINVCQAETIKFGEFIRTLPVPTSLHVFKIEPLRGHVLFMIESRLIFNLVDCFFGGTGKGSYKIEGRDFTSIEYRVIDKVVKQVLQDLEQAWQPVVPVSFHFVRSEVNPQFAAIIPSTDVVIVTRYEVEMDRMIGKMALALPYATIEPIRTKLNANFQSDQLEVDGQWILRLRKLLHDVQMELAVELGSASINGSELMNIEIGDVIMLDNDANKPLLVKVEGVGKFMATPGICRGNLAFQVHNEIISNE